jgi:hypothetical protein
MRAAGPPLPALTLDPLTAVDNPDETAAVTLGMYAHPWPVDDDRARGILDAALADCVRTAAVTG